jgi:hypothetical protein
MRVGVVDEPTALGLPHNAWVIAKLNVGLHIIAVTQNRREGRGQ